MHKTLIIVTSFLSLHNAISAQEDIVLDKISATVGSSIIKQSDINNQYYQQKLEGMVVDENSKCRIFEELLYQKLLLDQAKHDSLSVTESQVDDEINKRIKELTNQIGSEKKLETFYGKTILEIKTEWRALVYEQMLSNQMQGKIVGDVQVSPKEVREFFNSIPSDSLPMINPQYEIAQIVVRPPVEPKQKVEVKRELDEIRSRIIKGESFAKLAVLYSEDQASAKKGGELGFVSRSDLVPEFAAVAFKVKAGEVSRIVETEYGYHIIELIEKKGEKVNVRHILMAPKISKDNVMKGKLRIDSVMMMLAKDTLSFAEIALRYSDDQNSKNNGGLFFNPYTGSSKFDAKQIEPISFYHVKDLAIGKYSESFLTQDETGKQVYKIVKLLSKTEAHKASLLEDYQIIKEMALDNKRKETIKEWVKNKQEKTFLKLDPLYKDCPFEHKGWYLN